MLQLKNISFSYLKEKTLTNINFVINSGKTTAVIGESGCGKSTLLKLIYGLHDLNEGSVFWNDIEVLGPKYHLIPGMEFMKYLAQDFDLMPFISVAENVGKYLSNVNPVEKNRRVAELLAIVEMSEFASVKAKTLSGGQMQRVALARVLALEPEVLLLDEPFSHIDNFRKNSLRRNLFAYLKEKKITTIVATHDSTDVLSFADEVLILKEGQLVSQNTPENCYRHPTDFYTASLFGDVNEIEVEGKIRLVYPHQLIVSEKGDITVIVTHSFFKGSAYLIQTTRNGKLIYFDYDAAINQGKEIGLRLK